MLTVELPLRANLEFLFNHSWRRLRKDGVLTQRVAESSLIIRSWRH